MPGLFDNSDGSGLAGILGGLGATLFPGVRQYQIQQQNANTAQQALGPGSPPGMGQLLTTNPVGAGVAINQRNLEASIDALTPLFGRAGATYFSLHPEELSKYAGPQKLGPGEQLQSPLNLLGLFGAPNSSQQQPPSSQPGPSNASVGGGYQGPPNTIGTISDDAAREVAIQARAGDKDAMSGAFFAGPQGNNNRTKVLNIMAEMDKAEGRDPLQTSTNRAGFKAYEQGLDRLTVVQTNMGTAQIEAGKIMPLLKKAAADYYQGTGQFPPLNAVMQATSKGIGDPRVIAIGNYVNALRNTYARGISTRPQGPTVNDKNNFDEVLSSHWSPSQLDAAFDAINNEFKAAHDSIPTMKNQLTSQFGMGKPIPDDLMKEAKAAIAAGKPKERIIQRLQENGYDAKGF